MSDPIDTLRRDLSKAMMRQTAKGLQIASQRSRQVVSSTTTTGAPEIIVSSRGSQQFTLPTLEDLTYPWIGQQDNGDGTFDAWMGEVTGTPTSALRALSILVGDFSGQTLQVKVGSADPADDIIIFSNTSHAIGVRPDKVDIDSDSVWWGYNAADSNHGFFVGETKVTDGDIDLGTTGTVTINGVSFSPKTVSVCVDDGAGGFTTMSMPVLGADPA